MAIVTVEQLRRRCGSPQWSPEAEADAALILDEVEGELSVLLQAPISPQPVRTETAVLLDTGLVSPRFPIATLETIDGEAIAEPWLLEGGWLKKTDVVPAVASWNPTPANLDPFAPTVSSSHNAYAIGFVTLRYQPGWGDQPSLRAVIMEVARNRFTNRHDDTVTARDLDSDSPQPLPEEITDAMQRRVGIFKWHQIHR